MTSLLKLETTKAFDRKTTFLEFVIMTVAKKNPDLLNLKEVSGREDNECVRDRTAAPCAKDGGSGCVACSASERETTL